MNRNATKALIFLGLGTILFALGPAVLKLLTTMGGRFGIEKPGAISFCNVLFVGNFCAGLITLLVYGVGSHLRGAHRVVEGKRKWRSCWEPPFPRFTRR